jgi:hypothetical protein
MCWALSTGAGRRGEDREMAPDQGCYQERYRLTVPVARSAAVSLVSLIPAIFGDRPLPWVILAPVIFVLATVPWLVAVASRKIAFRADTTGITLGADPLSWPFRHASAVFVPWSDAEAIALYRGGGPFGWRTGDEPCLGIQRRADAPALSRGNKPARRCPLPGIAAGAARPVTAWRLDRDRLAALTAAVAPAIPIIDAGNAPNQEIHGPRQTGTVTKTGPAD